MKAKKIISALALTAIMTTSTAFAQSSSNLINILLNSKNVNCEASPYIKSDRVMVPVRAIFEQLGADVSWDAENSCVSVNNGSNNATLQIGSNVMHTSKGDIKLDSCAEISEDRTFVPIRAICEFLGCRVNWNPGNNSVIIDTPDIGDNNVNFENIFENIENIGNNGNTENTENESTNDNTSSELPQQGNLTFAAQVLELVNIERAKNGLSSLSYSSPLESVAYSHSKDMAENNYFSHTSLDGKSPFDRLKNAGISYSSAGENIAAGQKTAEEVVRSWMNSDGHRKNILNASFTKMGVGVYQGGSYGIYWTQAFTN